MRACKLSRALSLRTLRARTSMYPRIHTAITDMSQSCMGIACSKIPCIYYRRWEVFIGYHVGLASEAAFKRGLPTCVTRFLRKKRSGIHRKSISTSMRHLHLFEHLHFACNSRSKQRIQCSFFMGQHKFDKCSNCHVNCHVIHSNIRNFL